MRGRARPASACIVDASSASDLPLAERWRALFGTAPPERPPAFLAQAIAWKEQQLAHGDVPIAIRHELAVALEQVRAARRSGDGGGEGRSSSRSAPRPSAQSRPPVPPPLPPAASQLAPGTRLVKHHAGRNHVVEVTRDGFVYEGAMFASLSAVAKHITGTHWNGLLFFGLRERKTYPRRAGG